MHDDYTKILHNERADVEVLTIPNSASGIDVMEGIAGRTNRCVSDLRKHRHHSKGIR